MDESDKIYRSIQADIDGILQSIERMLTILDKYSLQTDKEAVTRCIF